MTSIGKKTEAVDAYLIENSKGEGEKENKRGREWGAGVGGTITSSRKDWAQFQGCIKEVSNDQSLQ